MRSLEPVDLPSVLALNNEHAVELSLLDETRLRALAHAAAWSRVIGPPGQPEAFLFAFDQDTPSQGPNHAWFLARHRRFLYVDRVCVAAESRRRGHGHALYRALLASASEQEIPVICCEVNADPPNPLSDAFHRRLGFDEVARAYLPDRDKTVRYLERAVERAPDRPA